MTDITELAQGLKAAANNTGADEWQAKKIGGGFYVIRKGSYKLEYGYRTYQPIAEISDKPTRDYVVIASPTNVLALIESMEKAQQRIAELESRTVTVKPMRPGHITVGGEKLGIYMRDEVDEFLAAFTAAGIKWEAE